MKTQKPEGRVVWRQQFYIFTTAKTESKQRSSNHTARRKLGQLIMV